MIHIDACIVKLLKIWEWLATLCRQYVDFLVLHNVINSTKILLSSKWEIKDLGEADLILGIETFKIDEGIEISHLNILKRYWRNLVNLMMHLWKHLMTLAFI